jgi:AcrR family transcriptional regulator
LTGVSSFSPDREGRADARRNVRRILDATADLLATDPAATLERVAARAGVSRATVYHHFASRDALLDALTERSIREVEAALHAARPDEDSATAAIERVLCAAWPIIGR